MSLKKEISRFQYEDICVRDTSVFPISTVCNAKCMFCSNKNNPFTVHRCGFRPLREVHEYVFRTLPNNKSWQPICLSDSIPGRISEGEALLHPHFFEICELIRKVAPHRRLHITTNGALLTKETVERIIKLKPFNIMMSYHSTDCEKWIKMFGNVFTEEHFNNATTAWHTLTEAGVEMIGAIVCMANVLGYDDIEKTLLFMSEYAPETIQVWEPGYSKYTDPDIVELMKVDPEEFKQFVHSMYPKCTNSVLLWNKDPDTPLPFEPYYIAVSTVRDKFENVYWLTAEASFERLTKRIADLSWFLPNKHTVVKVENHSFGGNINCNGLLMISDIQEAVNRLDSPDLIIVPDVMLDKFGNDLMEFNFSTIRHPCKPTVWWRH